MGSRIAAPVAPRHLVGLGLLHPPTSCGRARNFPGGWRMRVGSPPRLFAEPICCFSTSRQLSRSRSTLWLQDHLARYPNTMMIIRHDATCWTTRSTRFCLWKRRAHDLSSAGYSDFERLRSETHVLDQKYGQKGRTRSANICRLSSPLRAKMPARRAKPNRASKCWPKMQPINALVTDEVRPIHIPAPDKLLSPPIIATDDVAVGYEPGHPICRPDAAHRQ